MEPYCKQKTIHFGDIVTKLISPRSIQYTNFNIRWLPPLEDNEWKTWYLEREGKIGTTKRPYLSWEEYDAVRGGILNGHFPTLCDLVKVDYSKRQFTSFKEFCWSVRKTMANDISDHFEMYDEGEVNKYNNWLNNLRKNNRDANMNIEDIAEVMQALNYMDFMCKGAWKDSIGKLETYYQNIGHDIPDAEPLHKYVKLNTYLAYRGFIREHYVKHQMRHIHNEWNKRVDHRVFDIYETDIQGDQKAKIDFVVYCKLVDKWATFGVTGEDYKKDETKMACHHVFFCEKNNGDYENIFSDKELYVPKTRTVQSELRDVFEITSKEINDFT